MTPAKTVVASHSQVPSPVVDTGGVAMVSAGTPSENVHTSPPINE